MDANEARVREVWERADLCEIGSRMAFHVSLGGRGFTVTDVPGRDVESASRAWSAAAAFTEQVIEEARQLREEIGFTISSQMSAANYVAASDAEDERGKWQHRYEVWSRTQTRLEAIYAAHIRGIKPDALATTMPPCAAKEQG